MIRLGFSSLRFRKVSVALLLLPFSQLLLFVSWKEKVVFLGWFLLKWFNLSKLLLSELTVVTLFWYSGFPRLPNLDRGFLTVALRLTHFSPVSHFYTPWRFSPLPPRCSWLMLRFPEMSMLSSSNNLKRWWLVRATFPFSKDKVGCEIKLNRICEHRELLILIVRVCKVYDGPSNLLRC